MRLSREALDYRVVVRRVAAGPRPFQWEIRGAEGGPAVQMAPSRYSSMAAAYEDGQAWLTGFLARRALTTKRVLPRNRPEDGLLEAPMPLVDGDDASAEDDDAYDCGADVLDEISAGTAPSV